MGAASFSTAALPYLRRLRLPLPPLVGRQALEPVGPARDLCRRAAVAGPVRDGARGRLVPEHLRPAAYAGRWPLWWPGAARSASTPAGTPVRPLLVHAEAPQLVDHQGPRVRVVPQPVLGHPARRGVLQALDQPGAAGEANLAARLGRFDADRHREAGLSHARAPTSRASSAPSVNRGVASSSTLALIDSSDMARLPSAGLHLAHDDGPGA